MSSHQINKRLCPCGCQQVVPNRHYWNSRKHCWVQTRFINGHSSRRDFPFECAECKTTKTSKWFIKYENGKAVGRYCRACYRQLFEYPKRAEREGREYILGHNARIYNADYEKFCYACGVKTSKWPWIRNYDINNPHILLNVLCDKCYRHLIQNPNIAPRLKETNPYRYYIQEHGKWVEKFSDKPVRTGYCTKCTNNIFDDSCKTTNLRNGVELCFPCIRGQQIIPVKNTKIEKIVQKALNEEGIDFQPHYLFQMGKHTHQADIFIEPKTVINCDGKYWHSLPENAERDKRVDKWFSENGYKVLRFSEDEILKKLGSCISKIKSSVCKYNCIEINDTFRS